MVLLFSALSAPASTSSRTTGLTATSDGSNQYFVVTAPAPPKNRKTCVDLDIVNSSAPVTANSQFARHLGFRVNTFGLEMEADDDDDDEDQSENDSNSSSPPSSDISASSFDSRASFDISDVDRRQEMLDLSISKIHTINASHVPVSLCKSVLIYNTMKTLQRDLSVYESGFYASADEDEFEMEDEILHGHDHQQHHQPAMQQSGGGGGYPWPSERVYPEPQGGEWSWAEDEQRMDTTPTPGVGAEITKSYQLLTGGQLS
uniref:SERTA domain-containing protein n=1 Tax=Plectus sambesii TaxID=2011161 RepID=A0A914WP74_9BILA